MARPGLHRYRPVLGAAVKLVRLTGVTPTEAPTGEGLGESLHDFLVVGRDRHVVAIEHPGAVRIQSLESDGEQLQDLARVVLVRMRSLERILLLRLDHVQVVAHRRVQRDFLQQGAVVAEGVAVQHVHPGGHRLGIQIRRGVGHDEDLRQREGGAGAQLRLAEEPLLPDRLVAHLVARLAVGLARLLRIHVRHVRRGRQRELMRKPRVDAVLLHRLDLLEAHRTEARLGKQPGGIQGGGLLVWWKPLGLQARGRRDRAVQPLGRRDHGGLG